MAWQQIEIAPKDGTDVLLAYRVGPLALSKGLSPKPSAGFFFFGKPNPQIDLGN